jgi:UDPglucose--hexose-1-phosphate uridylyltransferase
MGTEPIGASIGRIAWPGSGRLADGREIIYFDEAPGLGRAAARDTREALSRAAQVPGRRDAAGAVSAESALRWDPLLGEWVIIAAQRQERTFLPPADQCPLCPSAPGRPTEIPAGSYDVVVFENRFPSLRGAGPARDGTVPDGTGDGMAPDGTGDGMAPDGTGDGMAPDGTEGAASAGRQPPGGLSPMRPAYGRCEVVCFTSDHTASFAHLPPRRVRTVVEAWAERTAALSSMAGIEQVYCFENRGEEIGVTLHHPHGQIYAFPFVTPRTAQMTSQAKSYAARNGGNLFDDLVAAELAAGTRIVAANEHWTAFVPAFARWPYEVLIFPVRRVPDLAALGDGARAAFGGLYLDILRRFDGLFGAPAPYIAAWHQAPVRDAAARREFALHLQVFSVRRAPGKLKYLAGTESGMGVWSNDIVPEAAARTLREVARECDPPAG